MTNLSRKERELQAREALIIETAHNIILEEGYFGLSIDKLAAAIEYSKGTIYQHFEAKEDIIMAIASRGMEKRVEVFEKAITFSGTHRERIQAIALADQLFVKIYPGHFQIEHLIKSRSLWTKTSIERQQQLQLPESRCGSIVTSVVLDAVKNGDLDLEGREPIEISFGLWTLALGVHTLVHASGLPGGPDLNQLGIKNPYETLRKNQLKFLDGIGWHPLSSEWDYEESSKKILTSVLKEEKQHADNL